MLKYLLISSFYFCFSLCQTIPKVSIITSLYNGDLYIEGFLENITQQTIFEYCELIIINANSPGKEEQIILNYTKKHSNIIYNKLDYDPGLYQVWNMAIKMARADFITNANLDDKRISYSIELMLKILEQEPDIDLVYSDFYVTHQANQNIYKKIYSHINISPEFSKHNMQICLPGPHPLWRKSMHEKYGYFDPKYKFYADYEMWLRAVSKGSKFKKAPGITCLYYLNPTGISTNPETTAARNQEEKIIRRAYSFLWS